MLLCQDSTLDPIQQIADQAYRGVCHLNQKSVMMATALFDIMSDHPFCMHQIWVKQRQMWLRCVLIRMRDADLA